MKTFASVILLLALVIMCSRDLDDEPSGTFTDVRDGITYKIVKIGEQWWMAENLAFKTQSGNYAFKDDENNVQKYGRLYTLEAARAACPNGWHLPTDEDWIQLAKFIMDDRGENKTNGIIGDISGHMYFSNVGKYLKSKTGWGGAGADYYGFNALPGGAYSQYSGYGLVETAAYWWSGSVYSNPSDFQNLFYWILEFGSTSLAHKNFLYITKVDRYSVRCIKDQNKL